MYRNHLILKSCVLFFFFSIAQLSFGQNLVGCPSCECANIFCSCKSGACCLPNAPDCRCTTFTCYCSCGAQASKVPDVNQDNVLAFATFLRTPEFNSPTATDLAAKFDLILVASLTGNAGLYSSAGNEAETIASRLSSSEKNKANAWIQSKGGTTQIR